MSHLTLEALARLLDEPPTDGERAHLGACDACRSELDALRGQTDALSALPDMVPAPDLWPEIRERLLAGDVAGAAGAFQGSGLDPANSLMLLKGSRAYHLEDLAAMLGPAGMPANSDR